MPFLAVAFWPWTAFSESVLRASGAVTSNAALIGKVAFPSELLPLSTVAATFLMHLAGYLAVLLVLQLLGTPIHWLGLLAALPVLLLLCLLACAPGAVRQRPAGVPAGRGADPAAADDVLVLHHADPVQRQPVAAATGRPSCSSIR